MVPDILFTINFILFIAGFYLVELDLTKDVAMIPKYMGFWKFLVSKHITWQKLAPKEELWAQNP